MYISQRALCVADVISYCEFIFVISLAGAGSSPKILIFLNIKITLKFQQ